MRWLENKAQSESDGQYSMCSDRLGSCRMFLCVDKWRRMQTCISAHTPARVVTVLYIFKYFFYLWRESGSTARPILFIRAQMRCLLNLFLLDAVFVCVCVCGCVRVCMYCAHVRLCAFLLRDYDALYNWRRNPISSHTIFHVLCIVTVYGFILGCVFMYIM